ncbi:MAG TPA: GNAT family N-acetyltransferase [Candidatus Bathyarchaeia archaeon]
MKIRTLRRNEIEKVRNITRNEVVEQVYYLIDGKLVLKDEFHNMTGWNAGELDRSIDHLYDIHDRNGTLLGAFVENRLIGVSALESEFIGENKDQLQLVFHQVDSNYRHKGVGGRLFRKAMMKAIELGVKRLFISATPSKNTIGFYSHMGCKLVSKVNPKLYVLEPTDIHLELVLK